MSGSYRKAKHQAAGHDGNFTDEGESLFFKPTTAQEVEFYQDIQRRYTDSTSEDLKLDAWMPVFLGTLELGVTGKARESDDSEVQSAITAHANLTQVEPSSFPTISPSLYLRTFCVVTEHRIFSMSSWGRRYTMSLPQKTRNCVSERSARKQPQEA